MKKNIRNILLLVVACLITASSCKKKAKAPDPLPPPADGTVLLHLHTNVDTNEVDYNTVYVMTGGRKISVSIAQLYISSVQLVKADGSTFDISGVNIAKTQQVEEYLLGNAPAGNYKSIKFNVGLAPSTNALLPEPSDSTFSKPNMWFGNTVSPWNGYVFVNLQGKIDTTNAANSTVAQMQPFCYRIGTNGHLKSVTMPDQNYTVSSNQTQFIHIIIDYNKLFSGVTLNNNSNLNVNSTADNAGSLANQIANNIPLMFHYE
jgi:hypothetical protein